MLMTACARSTRITRRIVVLTSAGLLAVPLAIGAALPAAASAPPRAARAAPAPNTWQPTAGAMSVARSGHTATMLRNGMVLIVGGGSAAADLYNPATGVFRPTGSMSVARPGASATLLPDGQVLVAGGCCTGSDNLSSAELYNPATGTWSATGSMAHARSGQTATLLPDGQVLVAGGACNGTAYGCNSGSSLVNQRSAELYNPATGMWSATGSMLDGREFATATLLPGGQVLVAGGFNSCDDSFCSDLAEAELYNPATGTWARTGSFQGPREQHTATLLPDGQVLVAGGLNQGGFSGGGGTLASAELYDPGTGTWAPTASMSTARYGQTATLLQGGWVLVAGGFSASAELYEPARKLWVSPGAMSTVRTGATATLLPDGHVLVTGGNGPDGTPQATAEVFLAGPGPLARVTPAALSFGSQLVGTASGAQSYTVSNDGNRALKVSGIDISGANPSDFAATGDCTQAPIAPGAACGISVRFAPATTGLRTAQVGVSDNAPLSPHGAAVAGYGAGPNAFAPTAPLGISRDLATGTLLPGGDVLIAGGEQGPSANPLSEAELYNPATRSFTATGSMHTGRDWATAVLLPDGKVLVAGGQGANFADLSSAELYDPATGTWAPTASMHAAGYALDSTLLPNGNVLVTGLGFGASAEVYDPAAGTWTDTGPVVTAQDFATATLLRDGEVLVAGGGSATELYNPATNDWTATGSLNVARQSPAAALLPDGQVLVTGGDPPGGGNSLASAELYNPATGTWKLTGRMISGRYGASATLLNNGSVLVAGGCTGSCGPTLSTTELYSGGFWTRGPDMTQTRLWDTATLLADGDLLIAGGGTQYCCGVTATAELLTLPSASVSPGSGPPGQAITVTGRGFYAGETVQVTLDFGTPLGKVTSTSAGTFVLHTKIPAGTSTGVHGLQASGQRSFATGATTFTVT